MSKHVPAGWQVKPLEKLASTRTGKMNPLVDDKIKYIGLEHIDNGAITINGYMWSDATASLNSLFKKDDILFGKLRPYLRKCIQIGFDGCCSGELLVLKANCESTNQNYLKCVLQSDPIYTFCDELSAGTKMPRVSWGDLKEFEVVLPPLPEQRKIAAVLSSADRSIVATEKLIAKLADLKKALMQQLLTKGIGHTEFKPSPLGPIPKSWEVKLLSDVISKIIDCEHKTAPFIDNGKYFVVRTNSIKDGQIIFEDAKYTHEEAFREWTQREIPQPGDVLFTREAPAGEAALVPEKLPLCLGQRMVLLKFNQDVNSAFFVYSLYGSEMRKCLNDMLIGTTVSRINMADIKLINCLIPPIDEQRKIADILNGVDRKLSAAKVKLAKAKDLKQGLMNDLLTGKVRVSS
ncbi:MAG: restriction endonuclease subunit S [Lentisphaerota bacterium]